MDITRALGGVLLVLLIGAITKWSGKILLYGGILFAVAVGLASTFYEEEIVEVPVMGEVQRTNITIFEVDLPYEQSYEFIVAEMKQNRTLLREIEATTVHNDSYPDITNIRAYTEHEHECLAKNIYFEARNQTLRGRAAVAFVTLNRLYSDMWSYETICEVVYDRKQFSWYWDGLSDRPKDLEAYDDAEQIAKAMLSDQLNMVDYTGGSTHYHADPNIESYAAMGFETPSWAYEMTLAIQIDTHIFYTQPSPEL